MSDGSVEVLTVPGLWNSGPDHWQSHWEAAFPTFRRVIQSDYETPVCSAWTAALEAAVREAGTGVVLAAHSLGCATVAHWATKKREGGSSPIRGALLVAPSDVESDLYPPGPTGFKPMPRARLPFRSIVVASSDDEYVSVDRAREFAKAWGSELVEVGPLGHINSASALGMWPEGQALLARLRGDGQHGRTSLQS
jgi:predicted alpha/beta hydrolase family esterase